MSKKTEQIYTARFHAKFLKIFSFGYTVELETQDDGDATKLTGSANLGNLGGVFSCEGRAEGTNFLATYNSKYDRGMFQMKKLL